MRSTSSGECALIDKARAGDRNAFGELVEHHMLRAYRVALGLVGSPDDALDLSQEAFARAFAARSSLDPDRPFFPWLYQILRRLCFNFLRNQRRRGERLAEAETWLVDEARGRLAEDPASLAERAELRKRIEAAVRRLTEREREVFVLREFEGLSYVEISAVADIPMGTVMSRLYAARRRLAAELGDFL